MLAQLDTKTVYTFMDSMVTIEEYVKRAKNLRLSNYRNHGYSFFVTSAYGFLKPVKKRRAQTHHWL